MKTPYTQSRVDTWRSLITTARFTDVRRPRPKCSNTFASRHLPFTKWCRLWKGVGWLNERRDKPDRSACWSRARSYLTWS